MKPTSWALTAILITGFALAGCDTSKAMEIYEPIDLPPDRNGGLDRSAIPWPVLNADFLDPANIARFTPYETGPGIAVCEPSGVTDPGAAAFGRGAARWLQLALSSQTALERMPSYISVSRALDRGAVPFRLTPAVADRIHHCTGATHALTSRVDGTGLSLQLYSIPEGKAVGAPIRMAGSPDQIAARLPASVAQLLAALGMKTGGALPRTESAGALRITGAVPRSTTLDAKVGKDVLRLAESSDLAALLAIEASSASQRPEIAGDILAKLPARAKENPLLWASGGRASVRLGFQAAPEDIAGCLAVAKANPHNYLANVAATALWSCAHQPAEATAYASEAVRCNAESPEAWRLLAESFGSQSEAIRQARSYGDLNSEELEGLTPLYRAQARAGRKSTDIDAAGAENWLMLSIGARFLGDEKTASQALWRAMELPPLSYAVVSWGMTIYSSMWSDDPRMLRRVQNAAASHPIASGRDRELIVAALEQQSRFDLVRKLKGMPAQRFATVTTAPSPEPMEAPDRAVETGPSSVSKPSKSALATRRRQLDEMAEEALKSSGANLEIVEPSASPGRASTGSPPTAAGGPPVESSDEGTPIPIQKTTGTQGSDQPDSSRILARTRETLFSLAWDPAGKRLAGAGRSGTLFVINASGKRTDLRGHSGSVYSLSWSPNGASLASGGADGTVRIWDIGGGGPGAILKGHVGPVRAVDWSARNELASGGDDRTIRLWNPTTHAQTRKLTGHSQLVGGVAFSPDGRRLFSTSSVVGAGEAIVWDAASGKQTRKIEIVPGFLQSIAWSPDGKSLAMVTRTSVAILDAKNGAVSEDVKPEAGFGPISILWEKGCGLVAGVGNRRLLSLRSGTVPLPDSLNTGDSLPTAIAWNSMSRRLVTAQNNGLVREWTPAPSAKEEKP